ncbi:probable serine/threonine-protein kinase DDB_G0291350 [Hibiscus syriacus]|uniref:probable serine/threonine-protein kinase DDB_G0291350 n=1 Tax=Hibiscus syriacus TaxID=106335 RepID=UPI001923D04F|nr:probable serine/threonine-protein kinase DDB_G0291350 [Hibiscus syriacus]
MGSGKSFDVLKDDEESGLNALYDAVHGGGDVWINDNRFKIVRQLGEGGFAYVYLVKEVVSDSSSALASGLAKKVKDPSNLSVYTRRIIEPCMISRKEFFSASDVLQIFRQLCAGLKHMHNFEPPYAHNDVKPGNILLSSRKGKWPFSILMDFGSARPARKQIRSRSEALQLQEWASEHCSAPFRAPELWDCPSDADNDEKTDIWSLGCTLYAIMYAVSPFEYAVGEFGGSLQLALVNTQIKWSAGPNRNIQKIFDNLLLGCFSLKLLFALA